MTVEYTLLALAVPALLAAAGFAVWTRLRTRRMLDTLGKMLDDAIRGEFRESLYDESRLSALETRMAHYLSASAVSAKNLAEEKDAIKTLIGDISHQTKTPIANLLLYAQLLEEQDLPPESREYVSALEHQAEKLRFLIDALVKTSRLESGVLAMTPKRHGIQQLLDAASAQAAPGAEAKAITLTVEPTDLTARFDPKWTAEALYNLVDNAVKYTPAGGAVTLRAVGYELFCRVDVTDTGPGIPESEQARIFQRFYRSPSASEAEGVGIGLYLARQIAAGQGGYLKVSSRPGEGEHLLPVPAEGGGEDVEGGAFRPGHPKSFRTVRFQKECGKISLVQSVLSKGNTDSACRKSLFAKLLAFLELLKFSKRLIENERHPSWVISALSAAALRRLRSESRLRAQSFVAIFLPVK